MKGLIIHLSTCDTCKKILKEIGAARFDFQYQDIKTDPLTAPQVDALAKRTGSYESLVNKRALMFRERGLSPNGLKEKEYRDLLLDHYTFLKRPVIDTGTDLFVGNEKKTVEAIKNTLG